MKKSNYNILELERILHRKTLEIREESRDVTLHAMVLTMFHIFLSREEEKEYILNLLKAYNDFLKEE